MHRAELTNKISQQEHQGDGDEDGTKGGTFPVAVIIRFLQAKGRPREGVSRQGPGRWRIDSAGRQRVAR